MQSVLFLRVDMSGSKKRGHSHRDVAHGVRKVRYQVGVRLLRFQIAPQLQAA